MIPVLWDSPVEAVVTGVATATTFSGNLSGATASVSSSVVVGSGLLLMHLVLTLVRVLQLLFSGALTGDWR